MVNDTSLEQYIKFNSGRTFTLSEALDFDEVAKSQGFYPQWCNAKTGNPVSIGRIKCTPRPVAKPNPIPEKYRPKQYGK